MNSWALAAILFAAPIAVITMFKFVDAILLWLTQLLLFFSFFPFFFKKKKKGPQPEPIGISVDGLSDTLRILNQDHIPQFGIALLH